MKKTNSISIILLVVLSLWGCKNNSTGPLQVDEASAQKQFVWNAMNYWYYWQSSVSELADNHQYFSDEQAFQDYLKGFTDAKALFNGLIYQQEDEFSFFIDNYETFGQSQQGVSKSFGFDFGLIYENANSNDIFGYVQYVLPASPADQAGLQRGDLFTKIDGTQLNDQNYLDLLQNRSSYELSLAKIENNSISETGETVSLQAVTLQEDPIFKDTVLTAGSSKVGYLMYNAFHTNSHQELNNVFGNFISQGIDDLVLDLRYNGGGAGVTSLTLASMISGLDSTNVFATYSFNEKRATQNNQSVNFVNTVPIFNDSGEQVSQIFMNKLGLNHVYILTAPGTASASEVLINGLKPYITVTLIGEQTVGKDEGSLTLYDSSPNYLDKNNANPNFKIAIQPIVLKVVNRNGQDYPNGFIPDYEVNELDYLDNLPPLGDKEDPLLSKALELISGQPMAKTTAKLWILTVGKMLKDSRDLKPYAKGLYINSIGENNE